MPDYLKFDPITKRIIQSFISADPSIVENLDNILEVTRSEAKSVTKFHLVENGQVRLMTPEEQDALLAEEAQAIIDAENTRIAELDNTISNVKLTDATLTKVDTKIDLISNLAEAKTFFKLLVRYLIKYAKNN